MKYTELFDYINKKEIKVLFGTGTAAIILPVGIIEYKSTNYHIFDSVRPLAQILYDSLNNIKEDQICHIESGLSD